MKTTGTVRLPGPFVHGGCHNQSPPRTLVLSTISRPPPGPHPGPGPGSELAISAQRGRCAKPVRVAWHLGAGDGGGSRHGRPQRRLPHGGGGGPPWEGSHHDGGLALRRGGSGGGWARGVCRGNLHVGAEIISVALGALMISGDGPVGFRLTAAGTHPEAAP